MQLEQLHKDVFIIESTMQGCGATSATSEGAEFRPSAPASAAPRPRGSPAVRTRRVCPLGHPPTSFTRATKRSGSRRQTPLQFFELRAQAQSERQPNTPARTRRPPQMSRSGQSVLPSASGRAGSSHSAASGGDTMGSVLPILLLEMEGKIGRATHGGEARDPGHDIALRSRNRDHHGLGRIGDRREDIVGAQCDER
jgi:hypothetical protein